jgi:hypothetical protein
MPSFFSGKFMVKKVLGEGYSGGVYWGGRSRRCNQRRE